jgi:hypothetical protein
MMCFPSFIGLKWEGGYLPFGLLQLLDAMILGGVAIPLAARDGSRFIRAAVPGSSAPNTLWNGRRPRGRLRGQDKGQARWLVKVEILQQVSQLRHIFTYRWPGIGTPIGGRIDALAAQE